MHTVGTTGDTVEVGQFKAVNKGALKAFFTLIEHHAGPHKKSRRTINCKLFESGNRRWFSFPSIEAEKNGEKVYYNLVSIIDTEYNKALQEAVLKEIDLIKPHEAARESYPSNSEQVPF